MSYERLSDTNVITEQYLDSILVEQRLIDSVVPSLKTTILGAEVDTPVMMPAFSHLPKYNGRELTGMQEYAKVAADMNMLNMYGMLENEDTDPIQAMGGKQIRVIKPAEDRDKIFDQIAYTNKSGAYAMGMDIDHIFGDGDYDVVLGERMTKQTLADMKEIIAASELPFVVKGVLSVQDAVKSAMAGADAILISHHHGRLPYAIPPLMVLPKIKEALEGTGVQIIVDCGITTGYDVYKALALGADAACVGRVGFWPALQEGGIPGLTEYIKKVNKELSYMMSFTGFSRVCDMDDSALWIGGKKVR